MKPYIIYTRRSTDDADNQKNSLEYQESACLGYAKINKLKTSDDSIEGLIEKGIIKERHSAYKASALIVKDTRVEYFIERPKFMQMVNLLLEGKYEGVIVLCWDRISRNDQSDMIVKELIDKHGIKIEFVQADYDHKTSSGALHRDIDGMFAQHHSRVTSEKVTNTFTKLRSEGKCTYTSNIGYLDTGSDKKIFDPERCLIIKRLFEQYDTGEFSELELTRWANKQGLTSKPRRRKRTKEEMLRGVEIDAKTSKPISKSTLHFILTSQFYIGKIYHNGKWLEGGHPSLIDESLFWRVQDRLKSKCVSMKYMDKPLFSYRGLVRCSCGRVYSPFIKKGHTYYNSKCKDGCCNNNRNIREDVIVDVVQSIMDRIWFNEHEMAHIEADAKNGLEVISKEQTKIAEDLHRRKMRAKKDLDYLRANKITFLREEVMIPEEWKKEKERLIFELKEIDSLICADSETEEEMLEYVLMVSELIKNASLLYKNALVQEKREIAHMIFSELVIVDGKLASYKAKPEFEMLLNRPSDQVGSPYRTHLPPSIGAVFQ
jgi:site-specific DNA recombinase